MLNCIKEILIKDNKNPVAERISNYCLAQEYVDCFGPKLIFLTNENISCHSSLPWATIKRWGNILSPSSTQAFWAEQTCPVFLFSLPHLLAAGQATNMTAHILSLHFLAAGRTSQHETTFTLLHWLSLTYFEQSTKHHEENSFNLWTIGIWEIILSSLIFPSKPTDPRRNKLDIFNSCFKLSILIPVLMTASQLLL